MQIAPENCPAVLLIKLESTTIESETRLAITPPSPQLAIAPPSISAELLINIELITIKTESMLLNIAPPL